MNKQNEKQIQKFMLKNLSRYFIQLFWMYVC